MSAKAATWPIGCPIKFPLFIYLVLRQPVKRRAASIDLAVVARQSQILRGHVDWVFVGADAVGSALPLIHWLLCSMSGLHHWHGII